MVIVTLINLKGNRDKKKYIPLLILIILMIAIMVIRAVDPFFNATSNIISLVALVMYFTIENPDLKMLNQLQLAQAQAEKSNKIKSEFLSSMSHEIRTPLNAIVGYSQLISYAKTLEEAKENAEEIVESSNLLLNMFSNIVDTYKLESNEIIINNINYDFYTDINNLLDLYEDQATNKKIMLIREINPALPLMYGDINVIKRILMIILDNAIRYTNQGIITIKTTHEINNKLCKLRIEVMDTGSGISETNLQNIFEMFNRGSYKDSNVNGIGLGLYIAKKLTNLINGQISIKSYENKGTTVIITLLQKIADKEKNI